MNFKSIDFKNAILIFKILSLAFLMIFSLFVFSDHTNTPADHYDSNSQPKPLVICEDSDHECEELSVYDSSTDSENTQDGGDEMECNDDAVTLVAKTCTGSRQGAQTAMVGSQAVGVLDQGVNVGQNVNEGDKQASKILAKQAQNLAINEQQGITIGWGCLRKVRECKKKCKEAAAEKKCKEDYTTKDNGKTACLNGAKVKDIEDIKDATFKGIAEDCDKFNGHGVLALAQAASLAGAIGLAGYVADAFDDGSGDDTKTTPPEAPTVIPSSSPSDFQFSWSEPPGFTTLATGEDGDDGAGTTPADGSNRARSGDIETTAETEKDDKDKAETPSPSNGGNGGASLAGNLDDDDKKYSNRGRKRSRYGGFGSFATGSSLERSPSNHDNPALGKGSKKYKMVRGKRISRSSLKRKLSSLSGRHKSIFEHMSLLIKSYCKDGGNNCR